MIRSVFLILAVFCCKASFAASAADSLLTELSSAIKKKAEYDREKEGRIAKTKNMLKTPDLSLSQRYGIHHQLIEEYKTFISDSAIHYSKANLDIANALGDARRITESRLDLSSLYVIAGMYIESLELLKSIKKSQLSQELSVKYYDSYKQLYNYYSQNNPYTHQYIHTSALYRDSLLTVLSPESNRYKIVLADKLHDEGKLAESKQILLECLSRMQADNHEKAIFAYTLANIYKKEGNPELQEKYYTISAICDIKNSIKENASLRALASTLYQTGQVERAYQCIRLSMEDAIFCNARIRTYEASQIFPIIDTAYKELLNSQKRNLQFYLVLVSILSVFLISAVIYVYRQMKKVARIRQELSEINQKLNELNSELKNKNLELQTVNHEISVVNTRLSEANKVKETYIGNFFNLCSTYINKLERFQKTLNKKVMDRKLEDLYRTLKSRDMIDNELKELYENFDNTFLHLYPNFVEEFNSLLLREERFVLKTYELLNVELRIFALIRLGITDSARIANFLHYSANTIYTYRTRVRNKAAVPREEFEARVMSIGSVKRFSETE
ncbi:DUF6377 domain-containing protein [Leadbetterella sp. DM7]|uniref:DUF6377 domain-containing protein n=1 Tax=Leadbetterella sp. DM7 TaxID=3235085 RepID=UPI00349EFDF7